MAGANSDSEKMEFYNLKGKVDETNEPHFMQSEKVDGKWIGTKRFDTMLGVIVGASIDEKEFKPGEGKKKFFVLKMLDKGIMAKLALTHNQVTYGIINSIASGVDTTSMFSIKVYRDKPTAGENGKIYYNGKSFVLKNNEKTEWLVRMQDAPKKEPVMLASGAPYMVDGKQVLDASKVQAYWENIFRVSIIDKIAPSAGNNAAAVSGGGGAAEQTNVNGNNGIVPDDLPF